MRSRNGANAQLKSALGWFLPAATFLWIGTSIADWALSEQASPATRLVQSLRICLVPGILSAILAQRLRFQPFALALCLLGSFLIPLGLAMESFCRVFDRPFVDDGGLGMSMMITSCFALAALPFLEISRKTDHGASSPDPVAVDARMFLLLAWIAAAASSASGLDEAALSITALLVAGAAAVVGQLSLSWIRVGTVSPTGLLEAPLKGMLAVVPASSIVSPEAAAICGLLGLAAAHGARQALRKCGFDDELAAASTCLGGGFVGLLVAPFLADYRSLSWNFLLTQWGVTFSFAILGAVVGLVSWLLLSWLTRLRLTAAEEPAGLDYSEHGLGGEQAGP